MESIKIPRLFDEGKNFLQLQAFFSSRKLKDVANLTDPTSN
jgi:hypothetical protein